MSPDGHDVEVHAWKYMLGNVEHARSESHFGFVAHANFIYNCLITFQAILKKCLIICIITSTVVGKRFRFQCTFIFIFSYKATDLLTRFN